MTRAAGGTRGALDERRFHAWLARTDRPGRAAGRIGDDVALFRIGRGALLATTDAFSEGTHFLPRSPPAAVGAALVEVNLSDLAAKGARPIGFLLDLLVPPGTPERWGRAVVSGARRALARHRIALSGGDTKPAAGRTLVGTAFGWSDRPSVPRRSDARVGDRLVVTGTVGRGGLAAVALREGAALGPKAIRRLLDVHARVPEGSALRPFVHAMIDSSDGLFESAHLLAEASRVAIELDPSRIPLDPGLRRAAPDRSSALALAGFGGDYELVGTIPPGAVRAAQRALRPLGCPLTDVGSVAAGRGAWLREGSGVRRELPRAGWDPFHPRPPK